MTSRMNSKSICPAFFHALSIALATAMSLAPAAAHARGLPLDNVSLEQIVISNLEYIASEQIPADNQVYQKGEWPTEIYSTIIPGLVGVGKLVGHNNEATAFTTATVANSIATIYLEHPRLRNAKAIQQIPHMIDRAVETFALYQEGDLFNFYPPREWRGTRVHQPIDMFLAPMWKGFTNVPEDADTTSAVYTTKLYQARIQGRQLKVPSTVLNSIESYRDLNRNPQFYNENQHRVLTSAYMTWQADENDRTAPRFWFAPPEKGTRIPFNKNDVDCIVNLNILRMQALAKVQGLPGQAPACEMINDMIDKNEHHTCGVYYPNSYNLAYSSAELERAGSQCVRPQQKNQTVQFILSTQEADGGWVNVRNDWVDRVQSTGFAMNALLQFGDRSDPRVDNALRYGVRFLLLNSKLSKDGYRYWNGELFFTATAIARSLIAWRSTSFTTAVAATALLKMHERHPELSGKDYFDMH